MKKLILVAFTLAALSLTACHNQSSIVTLDELQSAGEGVSSSASQESNDDPESSEHTASEEAIGQVFYEDDLLKAKFVDVIEQDILPGTAYVRVVLENKSAQEITVLAMNSSVNDTAVQYLGASLPTLQAGKTLNYSWFFPFENASISEVNEIKKLEFTLQIADKDMKPLVETERLTIEVS